MKLMSSRRDIADEIFQLAVEDIKTANLLNASATGKMRALVTDSPSDRFSMDEELQQAYQNGLLWAKVQLEKADD